MDPRSSGIVRAMRLLDRSTVARYAAAVLIVLVGVGLREVLLPGIGDKSPFLVAVFAVLAASLVGGWGPGMLATLLSAGLAAVFYLTPTGHLAVGEPTDVVRLAIFIAGGAIVTAVGGFVRRSLLAREPIAAASDRMLVLLRLHRAEGLLDFDAPIADPLSEREIEVMRLAALGLRNDEIAATLYVSGNTVKTHLAHAYAKLGARSRTEAVARCAALGLFDGPADQAARDAPRR